MGKAAARSAPADIARLAAAFFVVMIHASGTSWPTGVAFNALSRFGVPVFVILSGYFMLAGERSPRSLIKSSARLLALMLAWSAIYYAYNLGSGARAWEGPGALARYLVTEPVHMWYIYTTVLLYALTPLLGAFCRGASRGLYAYALLAAFGLGCVLNTLDATGRFPTLMLITENAHAPLMLGFIFFYLLGGYLRRFPLSAASAGALYALGLAGEAFTVWLAVRMNRDGLNELPLSYTGPGAALAAAAFTAFCLRIKRAPSAALSYAARCTLGVYLLHPMLILIPQHLGVWEPVSMPLWAAIPLRGAAVYLASLGVSALLGRVPALGRLFR